jgi:hypothetical protein
VTGMRRRADHHGLSLPAAAGCVVGCTPVGRWCHRRTGQHRPLGELGRRDAVRWARFRAAGNVEIDLLRSGFHLPACGCIRQPALYLSFFRCTVSAVTPVERKQCSVGHRGRSQ